MLECESRRRGLRALRWCLCTGVALLLLVGSEGAGVAARATGKSGGSLVRNGKSEGAIVIGDPGNPFYQFVAGELQRYVKLLSGADLPIMSPQQIGANETGHELLLVGNPENNKAVQRVAPAG